MTLLVQLVGAGSGPCLGYDPSESAAPPASARTCMGLASNAFVASKSDVTNPLH
jgi:hypothetical protein